MRLHILPLFASLSVLSCGGGGPMQVPPPTPTPSTSPTPSATPAACPSPATCPPARQWKIGIRECADVEYGGTCLVDTTPYFAGGRCNSEFAEACTSACGAVRLCEPDYQRGPDFTTVSGSSNLDALDRNPANPYQARLIHVRGRVKLRACWYEGAADQEGVLLDLSGATCGEVVVEPHALVGAR